MAVIQICATTESLGPSLPSVLAAAVRQRPWPGGGVTPVLCLGLGDCDIELWPLDPDQVERLGRRLIEIADAQRKK